MNFCANHWISNTQHLVETVPDTPVVYFCAPVLSNTLQEFQSHFPGLVTYALKAANDNRIANTLLSGNIFGFDVASGAEIMQVRALDPHIVLHYNNPVRSIEEIRCAVANNVSSYSVDSLSELEKLSAHVPKTKEIAVRFTLKESTSMCDFGGKFGLNPTKAAQLLQNVAEYGYTPALTFHVGTQCFDPKAFHRYIQAASTIVAQARVPIARINIGGGFPSNLQQSDSFSLKDYFSEITESLRKHDIFVDQRLDDRIVCEPGRAMVSSCIDIAIRVKALRNGEEIFLNDGVYGLLGEWKQFGNRDKISVMSPKGTARSKQVRPFHIFGPTCDSYDALDCPLSLPTNIQEGDYLMLHCMGAYSFTTKTAFNGYGQYSWVNVQTLKSANYD